jgi:large subunit ribosomal protein L32
MPVPKKKTSKSKKNKRRSHHRLSMPGISICPQCNEVKSPHRVCPHCGIYKGEEVLIIKEVL